MRIDLHFRLTVLADHWFVRTKHNSNIVIYIHDVMYMLSDDDQFTLHNNSYDNTFDLG